MFWWAIREQFALEFDPLTAVVELDSSSDAKWSRHLAIRLPDAAFANNRHAGLFIDHLLQRPESVHSPV